MNTDKHISKEVARRLLAIQAVFLRPQEPFTWASGIKSPIYCDNRLILSSPKERKDIENYFSQVIKREFSNVEMLMGTATAGIAHAAIVADILDIPMGYVRSSAKDHGRSNRIEGKLPKGARVVVVEDLISTAGSSLEVVECLREAEAEVIGLVSIFTYGMQKATDRLSKAGVRAISLSNLDALVEVAQEENYISKEEADQVLKFRSNPSDESWINCKK